MNKIKLSHEEIKAIAKELKGVIAIEDKQEILQDILLEKYDMSYRESIDAMLDLAAIGIYEM